MVSLVLQASMVKMVFLVLLAQEDLQVLLVALEFLVSMGQKGHLEKREQKEMQAFTVSLVNLVYKVRLEFQVYLEIQVKRACPFLALRG